MSESVQADPASGTMDNNGPDSAQTVENDPTEVTTADNVENAPTDQSEPFPAHVVKELRDENAKYRLRAKETAEKLHTELVRATGLLADPTDLPFNEDHLHDPNALVAAVEQLVTAKPHLKARRVTGDVGQGQRDAGSGEFDLAAFLRSKV
ncbi:hypothetical protein ACJH6H_29300 [Mycobacterium sp. SMC-21]|uniref:hypothetical protein n=1 Tax=Mycobacterium sp. SMC-21 TaxID=3381632 RepID=UPI0038778831